jgi:HAD superfamily hydrolase (TIGR01509 family)
MLNNNNLPLLLIFDWSGTISDDRIVIYETSKSIFKSFGVEVPEFKEFFRQATGTLSRQLKKENIEVEKDAVSEMFKKHFEIALESGSKPRVYAEAHDVLKKLHANAIKIAIVSAHPKEYLVREAEEYNILPYFTEIKAGIEDKKVALLELCKKLGISPTNAIYVGDTLFDMKAGQEAGIPVIGISHGYHSKEQLLSANPLAVVDNLIELERLFLKI